MPDFKITIPEGDALDALQFEADRVTATGQPFSVEDVITDCMTTKFAAEREGQLVSAAMAKVEADPDLKAFREKKAQEAADAVAAVEAAQLK